MMIAVIPLKSSRRKYSVVIISMACIMYRISSSENVYRCWPVFTRATVHRIIPKLHLLCTRSNNCLSLTDSERQSKLRVKTLTKSSVRCSSCETQNITNLSAEEKRDQVKQRKEAKRAERVLRQKLNEKKKSQRKEAVYKGDTLPGEKKDVTLPLPDSYSPSYVEAAWYEWWEKENFFSPDYKAGERSEEKDIFVMCLPPPNVTGTLHLGHALGNSIQDAVCRWHRMCGRPVLWNPGSDHAGIATQVAVEKQLMREEGKTRHDLGREEFVERVWKWKKEKGSRIYHQMRSLGSSLDWPRDCFTLDPKLSYAVNEAFIRLHAEGVIYRSNRLVHWSCALKSAISDIEVDNVKVEGKTYLSIPGYEKKVAFGQLVSFAYPVKNSDEEIVVATTRLETMLGDTGVAVHPKDPRYTHLHHQHILHPLTGRLLPIVCDPHVDMEFGTGAVKLTPAHDHNDNNLGQKHSLASLTILDDAGCLINVPHPYMGLGRFEGRRLLLRDLQNAGLYRGVTDHTMSVPICSRSGDVVEPLLKPQWYVKTDEMAQKAIEAVRDGHLEIIPSHYNKQWFDWLESARDWCISRQLWWGHRVPAYRVLTSQDGGEEVWVSGHSREDATLRAAQQLGLPPSQLALEQDDDVLDTWFSSALYPFSVFGWPQMTDDLTQFYPTSLLETASDIMYFWVARMVMLGGKLTGQLPFKQVLFHSVLRDSYGRKMSKSLGNVIDPMDVIAGSSLQKLQERLALSNLASGEITKAQQGQERDFPLGIPQCGTDALRFTLCSYNFKAHVCNVDVNHIKSNRNFCNKIWQAFRYSTHCLGQDYSPQESLRLSSAVGHTDLWILSRLAHLTMSCDEGFKSYDLNHVTQALHSFWWLDFCDVYIEYTKSSLLSCSPHHKHLIHHILYTCLDVGLRLLSPFMPYLTEELYQRLPRPLRDGHAPSVCIAPYPVLDEFEDFTNKAIEHEMCVVRGFISEALTLRRSLNMTKTRADVYITADDKTKDALANHLDVFATLSRSQSVTLLPQSQAPPSGCLSCHVTGNVAQLHMHIQDIIDTQQEKVRLGKQLTKLTVELSRWKEKPDALSVIEEEKMKSVSRNIAQVETTLNDLEKLL